MINAITATLLALGICLSAGARAQVAGDWWLVAEADRENLLILPASFKREGDFVTVTVRIDNRPRVSYQGKEAAQVILDAQGNPYSGTEHDWVIDCRDRSFVTRRSTQIGTDERRIETHSKGMPKNVRVVAPPNGSDVGVFFDSACRNALVAVNAGPSQPGLVLFRMNPGYFLLFDPQGVQRQGYLIEAIVRLGYRKKTALPDGQRVAVTDAIWAIDCQKKRGAVVAETKLAPDGKKVGELPKRTQAELTFSAPTADGLPEAFQRAVCEGKIPVR